jgi:hypothetical protein
MQAIATNEKHLAACLGSTVRLHPLCLAGKLLRRRHVGHHQKTHHIHAQFAGVLHVLLGNIGFGRVRGAANRPRADLVSLLEVFDLPMPGNSSAVTVAFLTFSATAAIHSKSECAPML